MTPSDEMLHPRTDGGVALPRRREPTNLTNPLDCGQPEVCVSPPVFGLITDEGGGPVGASVAGWGSRSPEDEGSYTPHPDDLDVLDATFDRADLTTFTRLDGLGLEVTGQRLEPDRAVLACRVVDDDRWCRRCGCEGLLRGSVIRELAAVRVAADDAGGHGPPVPVHGLRARVAPGHVQGGAAAGEDLPGGAGVGSGGSGRAAPDGRSGR